MTSSASAPFDKNGVLARVFAVDRRVGIIVRVSSPKQITNDGSLETQRRQATLIEAFFPKDQIDVFEILGESAREGARRPKFDAFLKKLDTGAYGLVVVYDFDRLTRNGKDEARLLEVMKRHNILLMAKGVLYDPTDPTEEMIWRMLSLIAAYDNALRSFRAILAKAAKANNGRLAVTLPAGLGWYDPEDASYQTAASALDLQSYLLAVDTAKVCAESRERGRRYALPAPDRDTFTACQLLMQYMREERSLPAVLARVADPDNSAWPADRHGLIPVLNKTRTARHQAGPTTGGARMIEWQPATLRLLASFFTRPAYYGIYSVDLRKLRGALATHAEKIGFAKRVFIENAFRSFGTSSEYHEFRSIVASTLGTRRPRRDRLRTHALPPVTCGELVQNPAGDLVPCGYRLSPVYDLPGRGNVYMSAGLCTHQQKLSFNAEAAVLDLICRCVSEEQLAEAVGSQSRRKQNKEQEIAKLDAQVQRCGERIRNYTDHIADLRADIKQDGDPAKRQELAEFQRQLAERITERDQAERALKKAMEMASQDESVTAKELTSVKQLAANLPQLLNKALAIVRDLPNQYARATSDEERQRIRAMAPLVRNLLAQVVRGISVRRLGRAVHEITVEFRNGASASTTVATTGTRATQAQQAWLAHRVGDGEDFAGAAADISAMLGCADAEDCWSDEDVRTAVVHYRRLHTPQETGVTPIANIAALLDKPQRHVEAALLRHPDAQLEVVDGTLVIVNDDLVLHAAIPELGCASVAARMGWRPETTVTLESQGTNKAVRRQIRAAAKREGRYAQDACGREYITFDRGTPRALDALLAGASAEIRGLDRSHWATAGDLQEICADRITLDRYLVRIPVGAGPSRSKVYYWADPAGRRRIGEQGLARSAAGREHLLEMVPLDLIAERLKSTDPSLTADCIEDIVRAAGVESHVTRDATMFVRVPLEVWGSRTDDGLHDWVRAKVVSR